jgi:hypothetical protein
MKHLKYISIRLLTALSLFMGLNQMISAQLAGNLWGQMTIGDPTSLINGDLVIKHTGELFLGQHSPRGLQTNMLSITGNYVGENGSQIHTSVINNSNLPNTRGYIDIVGTATKTGGATLIVLDYFNAATGWDGSCIDLIRANRAGSDVETFRMNTMTLNNRTAVLRHRTYDNSVIWYLAEKLITAQHTTAQSTCINEPLNMLSVVTASGDYTYQWYRCDAEGSNLVDLGSANGAQTPGYLPVSTTAGTSYYRCVVTSLTCEYNTDTTAVSGAITIGSPIHIISQPADYFVCNGAAREHTVLSIAAEGESEGITYQWYKNGIALHGSNHPDLDVELTNGSIDQYHVELRGCGTLHSKVVHAGFSLDIISQKMNSTLVVSNNSNINGGHSFVHYTWYKDDQEIASGSHDNLHGHYNAGGDLDPYAEYWVELIDSNGKHYRTCPFTPTIQTRAKILAYPNPVTSISSRVITVEIEGISQEELNSATIDVHSSLGKYIGRENAQGRNKVPVTMPREPGVYILQVKSAAIEQNIKIIVE